MRLGWGRELTALETLPICETNCTWMADPQGYVQREPRPTVGQPEGTRRPLRRQDLRELFPIVIYGASERERKREG